MKIYILRENQGKLHLLYNDQELSLTDILKIYPEKRVYALRGQMGAGKTTFVKALCEELQVDDVVNSPTFAIVNVYERATDTHRKEDIYHFDCYRLKTIQEALDFGAEEYLYSGKYCFIEWPERIEQILPEDTIDIIFKVLDNGERQLIVN